jgi:hypothetical protein
MPDVRYSILYAGVGFEIIPKGLNLNNTVWDAVVRINQHHHNHKWLNKLENDFVYRYQWRFFIKPLQGFGLIHNIHKYL